MKMRMMEQLVPSIAFWACAADADRIDTAWYCILDMQKSSFAWFACTFSEEDLRHNPLAPMMLRGIPPYTAPFSAVDQRSGIRNFSYFISCYQWFGIMMTYVVVWIIRRVGRRKHRSRYLAVLCFRMLCSLTILLSKSFKPCLNNLNCNSHEFPCSNSMQFSSVTI